MTNGSRPYGAVEKALQVRFGGLCSYRKRAVAVGVAQVVAAPNDPERMALLFVNLGATQIYVAPGIGVTALAGIRLGPNGGGVSLDTYEDAVLPAVEWFAIGDLAGGTLWILETFREVALSE